jgi:hypothetical protein
MFLVVSEQKLIDVLLMYFEATSISRSSRISYFRKSKENKKTWTLGPHYFKREEDYKGRRQF